MTEKKSVEKIRRMTSGNHDHEYIDRADLDVIEKNEKLREYIDKKDGWPELHWSSELDIRGELTRLIVDRYDEFDKIVVYGSCQDEDLARYVLDRAEKFASKTEDYLEIAKWHPDTPRKESLVTSAVAAAKTSKKYWCIVHYVISSKIDEEKIIRFIEGCINKGIPLARSPEIIGKFYTTVSEEGRSCCGPRYERKTRDALRVLVIDRATKTSVPFLHKDSLRMLLDKGSEKSLSDARELMKYVVGIETVVQRNRPLKKTIRNQGNN